MTEKENHLPNLSSEERAHALELAIQARRRYAALKARVKSGELTFTDAMDEEDAKRILVTSLLQSVPGIGASKAVVIMRLYRIPKGRPRKSKQTDCTVHEVGYTVSRHLEKVRRIYMREGADVNPVEGGGKEKAHRHVSPHVRRAHWHGYWLGKRDNPTDLVIKWIAPVIVNGGNGELLGRVHVGDGD